MRAAAALAQPAATVDLEGADPEVAARIEEARRKVLESPEEAAAWLELGKLYHAHQLTEAAVAGYRRAAGLDSDSPKAWYFLALAEAELGELEIALDAGARVVELVPGYAPVHWRRGRWLESLGRTGEAEAAFRRAVDVDPSAAAGWVGLASILLERGRAREAVDILRPVLAADRTNGIAGQLFGRALLAAGDETAARRVLGMTAGMGAYFPDPWHEEVLDSVTGVLNRLQLLNARMARGELDRVIRQLEALRESHPEHVGVLNLLSEGYLQLGRLDAARAVLEIALGTDPTDFSTLIHLAQAARFGGDLEAALGWADRALEANPRLWQGHFERASIFYADNRLEECLGALERAMRHGAHQNPNAWLTQGDALLRLARWSEAATVLERATARFPFLAQAWVGLAVAEVERGRIERARAALETAAELQPEDETMSAVRTRIRELERAGGGSR